MKKTILFLVAVLAVNVASAQFFIKAGAGYGLGAVTQAQSIEATDLDTSSATYLQTFQTASRYSYGNGIDFQVALGYDFTENLGFQLGANYLFASSPNDLSVSSTATNGEQVVRASSSKVNGLLTLRPAFTLSSNGDKVNLYSRVGMTIPIGGEIETNVTFKGGSIDQENDYINKGKMSFGYNAALGLGFPLSDKLSFWAEVGGNFLNIKSDTQTMTKYTKNGTDILDQLSKSQTEFVYVDQIDGTSNTSANEPTKRIANDAAFSSVGISAGIKFSLGNSREKRREGTK